MSNSYAKADTSILLFIKRSVIHVNNVLLYKSGGSDVEQAIHFFWGV